MRGRIEEMKMTYNGGVCVSKTGEKERQRGRLNVCTEEGK